MFIKAAVSRISNGEAPVPAMTAPYTPKPLWTTTMILQGSERLTLRAMATRSPLAFQQFSPQPVNAPKVRDRALSSIPESRCVVLSFLVLHPVLRRFQVQCHTPRTVLILHVETIVTPVVFPEHATILPRRGVVVIADIKMRRAHRDFERVYFSRRVFIPW